MKWGVQLIQITASFIGWYITIPAGAMTSKIRSKPWWMLEFWLSNKNQRKLLQTLWLLTSGHSRRWLSKTDWSQSLRQDWMHQPYGWIARSKGPHPDHDIESREIMWVHPDIVKDEQWETNKLKGKSCNVVSLTVDDDSVTLASLSNSWGEKSALTTQPSTSQPMGTRSGKQYLWQYDQTPNGASQPATSGIPTPVQAPAKGQRKAEGDSLWWIFEEESF